MLTNKDKKHIKKNIRNKTVNLLSQELGLEEKVIKDYLIKLWGKEKYNKVVSSTKIAVSNKKETSNTGFSGDRRSLVYIIKENWISLLTLIVLFIIMYANALNNEFVSDDRVGIMANPRLKELSYLLVHPYKFFSIFSYWVQVQFSPPSPAYFRIFSYVMHLLTVLGVFVVLTTLYNKKLAFIVSVLFVAHPILTESIVWVSARSYPLGAVFFIWAFYLYVIKDKKPFYIWAALILFILGLLSNEKLLPLISVFFLHELFFGNIKKYIKQLSVYVLTALVYLLIMFKQVFIRADILQTAHYHSKSIFVNPLTQFPTAIGEYIRLYIFPYKLSFYHTDVLTSKFDFALNVIITLALIAILGIFVYVLLKPKKKISMQIENRISNFALKYMLFWLLFFFVALSPMLLPVNLAWVVAERYVYLSSIGIFAIIGYFIYRLSLKKDLKEVVYILFGLLIMIYSVRVIIRNRDFKDQDTLWLATVKTDSSGHQIHNNLGDTYARRGDLSKAVEEFSLAIQIKPDYADAYHNLGSTYQQIALNLEKENTDIEEIKKYHEAAINSFKKALENNSNLWQSNASLASEYLVRNDYDNALTHLENAHKLNPTNPEFLYYLALIHREKGNIELSKEYEEKLRQLNPNDPNVQMLLNSLESK